MKKNLMIVAIAAVLSSCGVTIPTQEATIIPTAINTVNTASFSELNLDRKDYQILNTISAEAVITHTWNKDNSKHKLSEQNGEFFIEYVDTKMGMKTLSQQAEKNSDAFQKLGISEEQVANLSKEDLTVIMYSIAEKWGISFL